MPLKTLNCHIPLKLHIRGELSEDDWALLEEALVARYTHALRKGVQELTRGLAPALAGGGARAVRPAT